MTDTTSINLASYYQSYIRTKIGFGTGRLTSYVITLIFVLKHRILGYSMFT